MTEKDGKKTAAPNAELLGRQRNLRHMKRYYAGKRIVKENFVGEQYNDALEQLNFLDTLLKTMQKSGEIETLDEASERKILEWAVAVNMEKAVKMLETMRRYGMKTFEDAKLCINYASMYAVYACGKAPVPYKGYREGEERSFYRQIIEDGRQA